MEKRKISNDINDCFKIVGNDLIIKVKVNPSSSKNNIDGVYNNTLKISLTAPPVEGKANKKIIAYLAKKFAIAKSKIEIISGKTSKNKLIKIYNISQKDFLEKIEKNIYHSRNERLGIRGQNLSAKKKFFYRF